MQIDMQQQGRHTRLQISGELTIYDAVALHRALLESLGACDSLELDLAAVTDLDAAGLQQLMLLRREARATGKPCTSSRTAPRPVTCWPCAAWTRSSASRDT